MRKTLLSVALVLLIGAPAGFAQSGGTSTAVKNPGGGGGGVLPAPVGHRQPRAGDVPDDKNGNPSDFLAKENATLDKKLKSICRGC